MSDENLFTKYRASIEKALIKKALGFSYNEVIEEFTFDDDVEKLSKKKVTRKKIPPDISAVKVLLDIINTNSRVDLSKLTDEELEKEIEKAVKLLEKSFEEKTDD